MTRIHRNLDGKHFKVCSSPSGSTLVISISSGISPRCCCVNWRVGGRRVNWVTTVSGLYSHRGSETLASPHAWIRESSRALCPATMADDDTPDEKRPGPRVLDLDAYL